MTHPPSLSRSVITLSAALCACASAPRTVAPQPIAQALAPVTSVPHATVDAPRAACDRACAHIAACTHFTNTECVDDCEAYLASTGSDAVYARCVSALTCDRIRASMMMNVGPLMRCYAHADSSSVRR